MTTVHYLNALPTLIYENSKTTLLRIALHTYIVP